MIQNKLILFYYKINQIRWIWVRKIDRINIWTLNSWIIKNGTKLEFEFYYYLFYFSLHEFMNK